MRTIYYTGKVDEDGSLVIPRDALDGLAVQPGDELEVSVRPHLRTESEPPKGRAAGEPKTLADLFAGSIGGFQSGRTEERLSENCGEKFTDYLLQKRKEGHL
jgi:hypothetical protein